MQEWVLYRVDHQAVSNRKIWKASKSERVFVVAVRRDGYVCWLRTVVVHTS